MPALLLFKFGNPANYSREKLANAAVYSREKLAKN